MHIHRAIKTRMWSDIVYVEVHINHPQFVLIRVSDSIHGQSFLITMVFASPDSRKQRLLSRALENTIPTNGTLWLAIGDCAAILASNEKKGRRTLGKWCSLFGDFMDSNQLLDLGFRGPHFTW